jgi:hypothetical protein
LTYKLVAVQVEGVRALFETVQQDVDHVDLVVGTDTEDKLVTSERPDRTLDGPTIAVAARHCSLPSTPTLESVNYLLQSGRVFQRRP